MADVTRCKNCGKHIPTNITTCPYCNTGNTSVKPDTIQQVAADNIIRCKSCGKHIPPSIATCPYCKASNSKLKPSRSSAPIYISLAIFVGMLWFFAGGGLQKMAGRDLQKIQNQVAGDAVQQYEIAERQGNPMQMCVQAGLVSASYLQAKDETNYQLWKTIEGNDCRRAGVTR